MSNLQAQEQREDSDDLVWHYTNGSALQNIITQNELWASNTAFMNDSYEWRLADRYLIQAKQDLGDDFPQVLESYLDHVGDLYDNARFRSPDMPTGTRYLLSASKNGDSLTMWRGYAGTDEVSYAVGLDRTEPLKILKPRASENGHLWQLRPNTVSEWFDVVYSREDAAQRARAAIQRVVDIFQSDSYSEDQYSQKTGDVIVAIGEETEPLRNETKHHGFVHEEEARVIVDAGGDVARYRPGRLGMVPYVALTGTDGSEDLVVERPNLLPIRRIRISPGPDRFYAIHSLRALLDANGYGGIYNKVLHATENEVIVDSSEIPFR